MSRPDSGAWISVARLAILVFAVIGLAYVLKLTAIGVFWLTLITVFVMAELGV